jgi:glycosyltransferase involved in cell wall biosynthesis
VVIPSMLRPTLQRAIRSARDQDYSGSIEIVVVADRDPSTLSSDERALLLEADIYLTTGGGTGAAHARNSGVERSTGDYVCFLDDDDRWAPGKLAAQLPFFGSADKQLVVSCLATYAESSVRVIPSRLISRSDRVEDYLFRGRSASATRPSLFTSTLMTTKAFAVENRWGEDLTRHQDWDWLINAQRNYGATVIHAPVVGAVISVGSSGSISATSDWRASLDWYASSSARWHPKTAADFLTAQTLRYAISARSAQGVLRVARAIWRTHSRPSASTLMIACAGLVGRSAIEAALRGGVGRSCDERSSTRRRRRRPRKGPR